MTTQSQTLMTLIVKEQRKQTLDQGFVLCPGACFLREF